MPTRELRSKDDPILRKKAKPISNPNDPLIHQLAEDMANTMYAAPGVGLAAPQIGVSKRILVADCGKESGGLHVVINPKIISQEGTQVGLEGCLSFPNIYGDVERAEKVIVKFQDLTGHWVKIEAHGLLSRCLQHEIDHLDGILFVDKATNLREIKPEDLKKEMDMEEAGTVLG